MFFYGSGIMRNLVKGVFGVGIGMMAVSSKMEFGSSPNVIGSIPSSTSVPEGNKMVQLSKKGFPLWTFWKVLEEERTEEQKDERRLFSGSLGLLYEGIRKLEKKSNSEGGKILVEDAVDIISSKYPNFNNQLLHTIDRLKHKEKTIDFYLNLVSIIEQNQQ
jgi:hypothetical protein